MKKVKSFKIQPWHGPKIAYRDKKLLFPALENVDFVALPRQVVAGKQSEWEILLPQPLWAPTRLKCPVRRRHRVGGGAAGVSVGSHSRRKKRVLPVYLSGVTWFSYWSSCRKLFSALGRWTLASLGSEPERGLKVRLWRERVAGKCCLVSAKVHWS